MGTWFVNSKTVPEVWTIFVRNIWDLLIYDESYIYHMVIFSICIYNVNILDFGARQIKISGKYWFGECLFFWKRCIYLNNLIFWKYDLVLFVCFGFKNDALGVCMWFNDILCEHTLNILFEMTKRKVTLYIYIYI